METKKCPFCGKTVLALSRVCKHCGKSFDEIEIVQKEAINVPVPTEATDVEEETKTPIPKRLETKKCPACNKTVLAASEICKHCGKTFEEPVQEEENESPVFEPQSQQATNESTNSESVVHTSEQYEQEPVEPALLNEEKRQNNELNQNEESVSPQPEPTPFVEQQQVYIGQQNVDKRGLTKTRKLVIYTLGVALLIFGAGFLLLKINRTNPQREELIQVPKEDTIPAKNEEPSFLGLEPTISYSAPSEIVSSSGENFNVEAGDFFIGTLDEKGNPENGKLYEKNGRPKHVILPRRNH